MRPSTRQSLPHTTAARALPLAAGAQTASQRRARHTRWALHLGTGLLIALSLALATPAEAKKKSEGKQQTVRVKHQSTGSGETRAERERRLTRECRGRPNAGACLGFAS